MNSKKVIRIFAVLFTVNNNVLGTTLSNVLLQSAPENCRWSNETLICKLTSINSDIETASFSAQNTKKLKLECENNSFLPSSLNAGSLRSLITLGSLCIQYCKLHNLTRVSFSGLKQLRNLTLQTHNDDWSSESLIIAPDLFNAELSQLQVLELSHNNLHFIPEGIACQLLQLVVLNLSENRLKHLHFGRPSKSCGASIQILNLSSNNIDTLATAQFSNLAKLTELRLQKNGMLFIADGTLQGLQSLKIFDVSNNHLKSVPPELFSDATAVKELYFQNNSISVLAPGLLTELAQLLILDLSMNQLSAEWINAATFRGLSSLLILDLSNNKINRLEQHIFRDLKGLKILKIQNNFIKTLLDNTFSSMSSLNSLILSYNQISSIGLSTFFGLAQLSELSIDYNNLSHLDVFGFSHFEALQDLHLNGNALNTVPDVLFYVTSLKTLDLGENSIKSIEDASFSNMTLLYGLRLTDNKIPSIKRGMFDKMQSLQILNLSQNKIKTVESGSFEHNLNLQATRLDGNLLTELGGLFSKLPGLVWLNVSDNRIETFDFVELPVSLQWLDIHANRLKTIGNSRSLEVQLVLNTLDASSNYLTELTSALIPSSIEMLFLSNNRISRVQPYAFFKKPNLTRVELFNNQISSWDANTLRVSTVEQDQKLPEFYISGNPYSCDCHLSWLVSVDKGSKVYPTVMDMHNFECNLLEGGKQRILPLLTMQQHQFLCPYETYCTALCQCCDYPSCDCQMRCPTNCRCFHDQTRSTNIVDCSNIGYETTLPAQIPMDATRIRLDGNKFHTLRSHEFLGRKFLDTLFLNRSSIEKISNRTFYGLKALNVLYLQHNFIVELVGEEFIGLEYLKKLYLQHNKITAIRNQTFSHLENLKVLSLDNNQLINLAFWGIPNSVDHLRLYSNLWSCDCDFIDEFNQYINNHSSIGNHPDITCNFPSNFSAFSVNNTRLCRNDDARKITDNTKIILSPHRISSYVPFLVAAMFSFIVTIIMLVICLVFQHPIKVWLYSRFGVRLISENDDPDKTYHAFVSYSSQDESFVIEELASVLENTYKLCIHYRDFPAGAYIADTVVHAVASSHRTIMVVSSNFLKSEWKQFEFKSAHQQVLRDRRRRLIIIFLGEVLQKDLDSDLSLYLKAGTHLKWGELRFWEKLRFALPDVSVNHQCLGDENVCLANINEREQSFSNQVFLPAQRNLEPGQSTV